MPFQSWNFIRNQNFTRDRSAGPPDHFISAEKVDDELSNIADGLTETRVAAATADEKAGLAHERATQAETGAVATIRDGIDEPRNTLKKLLDWVVARLGEKFDKSGGGLTGDVEITKADPSFWFQAPGRFRKRWILDHFGNMILMDQSGQSHIVISPTGAVSTQQLGDLNTHIENRAAAHANARAGERIARTGDTMSGDLGITKTSPMIQLHFPGVAAFDFIVASDGTLWIRSSGAGGFLFRISPNGAIATAQMGDVHTHIENRASAHAVAQGNDARAHANTKVTEIRTISEFIRNPDNENDVVEGAVVLGIGISGGRPVSRKGHIQIHRNDRGWSTMWRH